MLRLTISPACVSVVDDLIGDGKLATARTLNFRRVLLMKRAKFPDGIADDTRKAPGATRKRDHHKFRRERDMCNLKWSVVGWLSDGLLSKCCVWHHDHILRKVGM